MKLVFIGSNHNILQMADIANAMGMEIAGIVDHDYYGNCDNISGIPVIGTEKNFDFSNYVCFHAVNAIPVSHPTFQRNLNKRIMLRAMADKNRLRFVNLIHPTAVVAPTVVMGVGNMICAGAVIANDVVIANHCQIREQSYVAHNATLADDVVLQVQSYVGSGINVGERAFVSIKSTVLSIGDRGGEIPAETFVRATEKYVISG